MPRPPLAHRLNLAMQAAGLTPAQRQCMMHAMNVSVRTLDAEQGEDWNALIDTVRRNRNAFVSNRLRWNSAIAPLYAEYASLLDKTLKRITGAHTLFVGTLEDYTAQVRAEGDITKGACNKRWQSWIPDGVKADFTTKLRRFYDTHPDYKGKRMKPFIDPDDAGKRSAAIHRLNEAIERTDAAVNVKDHRHNPTDKASSTYGAMCLLAAREARAKLKALKESGAASEAFPVNWHGLLSADTNARLRAYADNPKASPDLDLIPLLTDDYEEE